MSFLVFLLGLPILGKRPMGEKKKCVEREDISSSTSANNIKVIDT